MVDGSHHTEYQLWMTFETIDGSLQGLLRMDIWSKMKVFITTFEMKFWRSQQTLLSSCMSIVVLQDWKQNYAQLLMTMSKLLMNAHLTTRPFLYLILKNRSFKTSVEKSLNMILKAVMTIQIGSLISSQLLNLLVCTQLESTDLVNKMFIMEWPLLIKNLTTCFFMKARMLRNRLSLVNTTITRL